MGALTIRDAGPEDAARVLRFIDELAAYEKEPDAVEVDEATLREQMSAASPPFRCLLAEEEGEALGFALYFFNYSTWKGRPGLYLEDLFVTPSARGRGIARALMARLATIAKARDAGRMEWSVLDWNELAHGFYERLGAKPMSGWTTWRMDRAAIDSLAG